MKHSLLISTFFLFATQVFAQPPSTEIYLVDVTEKNNKYTFSSPVNITHHEGYDNQPEFSAEGNKIMYVSMPDTSQTDIFEYHISDSTTHQMTFTPESEYSPKLSPYKMMVTYVRVDNDKGQRLYQSASDFSASDYLIYGLDSIGYYLWLDDSVVALVCLNNGLELFIYDLSNGQFMVMDKGVGRCLIRKPGTADLIYTKKTGDKIKLYRFSAKSQTTELFCEGMDTVEDYVMTPDGKLLAGSNGKLYIYDPDMDKPWNEIADFSKSIGSFYRMSLSADGKRLALVAYQGKRP